MNRRITWVVWALVLFSVPAAAAVSPSVPAKAAFDRAEKALGANQLDAAASAYRESLTATPGYAPALNGLGSVLFKQGSKDEAIAQFKAAIAADPAFKLAYFNLGYAARKTNDFVTAAAAYEKYTQLDPADADGFYGLAESYRQTGQSQKAIVAYEGFLAREKRASEQKWIDRAKEFLAALRAETGAAPVAAAPQAGATPPASPAATPVPPAPATTTQAQPQAPGLPAGGTAAPAVCARKVAEGDKLMQDKKYRDASFAFQDATNADPSNVEALFKLGNTYAILGYYAQAIERWSRVAQLSTDPAISKSAQDNIAKAQTKMAQVAGGSPQAQGKAAGSGPVADSTREQARAAYEQGVKRINARDYGSALTNLSNAISLEPTLAVAYVARGSAQIGLRRFSEAAADYQYALRLDGSMASPLYGLAEAFRAMGRTADARTYYERYGTSTAADVRSDLQSEARQKADRLK